MSLTVNWMPDGVLKEEQPVVTLPTWDFQTRRRPHPATLWGGLLTIISKPMRLAVSGTEGWRAFARWATGLLG
jgi:hypothetical protein